MLECSSATVTIGGGGAGSANSDTTFGASPQPYYNCKHKGDGGEWTNLEAAAVDALGAASDI